MVNVWDIEVSLCPNVSCDTEEVKTSVINMLTRGNAEHRGQVLKEFNDPLLQSSVKFIRICDQNSEEWIQPSTLFKKADLNFYFYTLKNSREMVGIEVEDSDVVAATQFDLPNVDFDGLWESLILEPGLKKHLLNFLSSVLLFSDNGVDSNIISCNGIILFYGPPGTGKTTLCKALAQKLSIKMKHRYASTQFFEVNTHSLFSKWFSQSGKVVAELFTVLRHIIHQRNVFVCILLDEVESLAHTRTANQCDPSDAIRVVNAVLTNLDDLRRYPNVLIVATSNLTNAIDSAFMDRADIKQYIGPPNASAIYEIYFGCLQELKRVGLITGSFFPFSSEVLKRCGIENNSDLSNSNDNLCSTATKVKKNPSAALMSIARNSVGLSGRTLRKIPTLAYSKCYSPESVDIEKYLQAMEEVVIQHKNDKCEK